MAYNQAIIQLSKNNALLNEFIVYYRQYYNDAINVEKFMTLPFSFQLGIFLIFFEDIYNYAVHADRHSVVILYPDIERARSILITRKSGIIAEFDNICYAEFAEDTSKMVSMSVHNYETAVGKIIELISKPPF